MTTDKFVSRHNGPRENEIKQMLAKIGVSSVDELINQTVPSGIRLKQPLAVSAAMSEFQYSKHLKALGQKNKVFRSYIGLGYYNTILPAVIQRNVLENPGWYTAYTPYQAEIAQGRLEAILNFQTMVMDLTGMPLANASLLDEATAAAEALFMFYSSRSKDKVKNNGNKFFISQTVFPQTIDVVKTRAVPYGIELVIGDAHTISFDDSYFGALIQYPDINGEANDYKAFVANAKAKDVQVCVATDLLALALLTPPGEWGADCVVGNSQRFGVPLGYGGPHAAFFTCKEEYKRAIPGRIIGVSVDAEGNPALRMALQTREQHIKRDKATSNICTAQALLAIMASMYAVYHGQEGIKAIATGVHHATHTLATELQKGGFAIKTKLYFDTIIVACDAAKVMDAAIAKGINFRLVDAKHVGISLDQTVEMADLIDVLSCFGIQTSTPLSLQNSTLISSSNLKRQSAYLTHPTFNSYHSESEMMRYIKRLENKDLSLVHSMIALGSCTMKLNAASELLPITWPEFANIHPFVPINQAQGYAELIEQLNKDLSEITGFARMSFQPNSGAQGEYAGLMVIRAYHIAQGHAHRNVAIIPSSAHGTNPASAAMAGMKIIISKCDDKGNIDLADLRAKAEEHKDNLSCLMVTYPSTHGVYEESITEITKMIHDNGGLVYMDGANMNAQVGLTSPGNIGADVCHLNLHKTFAIPHGGGGPGMGPIGVVEKLVPFLPSHTIVNITPKGVSDKGITAVSAAPYGSALILLISYGYIKMLGFDGLKQATEMAILNANYMKVLLEPHYKILYTGKNGHCAHEMILDCNGFKATSGVEVGDMAKRLIDYGFHAPTVAFPVHDTLMIEPTESESKAELDRFCEAMISIRKEIKEIEDGKFDKANNILKNAPHTCKLVVADNWEKPYTRQKAAFPLAWVRDNKFWPSVAKVDSAYGDRNLVCSCAPIEAYMEEAVGA